MYDKIPLKSTYISAGIVAILIIIWLLSGQFSDDEPLGIAPPLAEQQQALDAEQGDRIARVRAQLINAEPQPAEVVIRGRTQVNRSVIVRAETEGRVTSLPVQRGDRVNKGDVLCQLETNTRQARIDEAEQAMLRARLEYEGALELQQKGLQSGVAVAIARASYVSSQANFADRELDYARTRIRAPFAGIVEEQSARVGSFLGKKDPCARMVDISPILLVGEASEQHVNQLQTGLQANARLATGQQASGTLTFVSHAASQVTRTYPVEITVPNPDLSLRGGITAEIRIAVAMVPAHLIPASVLSLDDDGKLGVHILDEADRVQFSHIQLLRDDEPGVWVSGLPMQTRLITVGHALVSPGQKVEAVFVSGSEPAQPPALTDLSTGDNGADNAAATPGADHAGVAEIRARPDPGNIDNPIDDETSSDISSSIHPDSQAPAMGTARTNADGFSVPQAQEDKSS